MSNAPSLEPSSATSPVESADAQDSKVRGLERARQLSNRQAWITDLSTSALIVICFSVVSFFKGIASEALPWLDYPSIDHIGAEYNCIAEAIVNGRGFSDPFYVESGPTAWMPPALPYIQAGLYQLHGNDR